MAEQFGADHSEMIIGPKDYEKYYERYLWDLEEPVGNESAAAFYFVSQLAGRKVKVALTGQGADEPWAGYDRYVGIKLSELYHRLPSFITDRVIRRLIERASSPEHQTPSINPPTPPSKARSNPSVSSCRTIRHRLPPRARRSRDFFPTRRSPRE